MKDVQENINLEDKKFGDVNLTGTQEYFVSYADYQTTHKLINDTIFYL